jgi:hypothetical protein
MSDFLGRLAARSLGLAPVAQPLGRSMFAPGLEQAPQFEQASQFQGPQSGESVTATTASSSRTRPDFQGHTASPSTFPTHTSSSPLPNYSNPQPTDFSVVDPRAIPFSNMNAERPPRSEQDRVVQPLAERIRATGEGHAGPDTSPQNIRDDIASPSSGLLVTPPNFQREAFPASSFTPAAAANRDRHANAVDSAPVVKVSIGRVEIRAEFPAPAPRTSSPRSPSPTLSLDEYARQRREGKR